MKDEKLKELIDFLEMQEVIKLFEKSNSERKLKINLLIKELIEEKKIIVQQENEQIELNTKLTNNYINKFWMIVPENCKEDMAEYFNTFLNNENKS